MVVAMSPSSRKRKQKQQQENQQQQEQQVERKASGAGGLLGKILLPSYTDAGASTSYGQSSNHLTTENIPMHQRQQQQQHDENDVDDDTNLILPPESSPNQTEIHNGHDSVQDSPDTFSEAATELHDNRSGPRAAAAGRLVAAASLQLSVGSLPPHPPTSASMLVKKKTTAETPSTTPDRRTRNNETNHGNKSKTNSVKTITSSNKSPPSSSSSSPPTPSRPSTTTTSTGDHTTTRYSFFPSTKPSPTPTPSPITSVVNVVDLGTTNAAAAAAGSKNRTIQAAHHSAPLVMTPPRITRLNDTSNKNISSSTSGDVHNTGNATLERSSSTTVIVAGSSDNDGGHIMVHSNDSVSSDVPNRECSEALDKESKPATDSTALHYEQQQQQQQQHEKQEGKEMEEEVKDPVGQEPCDSEDDKKRTKADEQSDSFSTTVLDRKSAVTDLASIVSARLESRKRYAMTEGDDDINSEVSSTASEMGTVVNMGEEARAERMKELDAMAAAMDAEDGTDNANMEVFRKDPTLDSTTEEGDRDTLAPMSTSLFALEDSGLSLPTLESKTWDQPLTLPSNRKYDSISQSETQLMHQDRLRLLQSASFDDTISRRKATPHDDVNDMSNDAVSVSTASNGMKGRHMTASGIVSATLRRIGNKTIGGNKATMAPFNTSISAPNTPRSYWPDASRAHDLIKSTLSPKRVKAETKTDSYQNTGQLQTSFSLRSPGSLATQHANGSGGAGKDTSQPSLSPRFSSLHQITTARIKRNQSMPLGITRNENADQGNDDSLQPSSTKVSVSPRMNISQTFQIAQKCFSFDTTMDGQYSVAAFSADDPFVRHASLALPSDAYLERRELKPRLRPLDENPETSSYLAERHLSSQSWDAANPSSAMRTDSKDREPFRLKPSWRRVTSSGAENLNSELQTSHLQDASVTMPFRGRISSDFSPAKYSNVNAAVELKLPDRIEIEREDALDILTCLVEQGMSDWNSLSNSMSNLQNEDGESGVDGQIVGIEKEEKEEENKSNAVSAMSEAEMVAMADEIRKINQDTNNGPGIDPRHMAALEELLRSHAYANEMKRASASASAWLTSIGRGTIGLSHGQGIKINNPGTGKDEANSEANEESTDEERVSLPREGEKHMEDLKDSGHALELATLRAMLHNAELKLSESQTENRTLNEELSTCRAEIGRLKSFTRNEHVNRSILDESHDTDASTVTGLSETISKDGPVSPIQRSKSDIDEEDRFFDVSNLDANHGDSEEKHIDVPESNEVAILMKALEQANDTIRRLHGEVEEMNVKDEGEATSEAPVVNLKQFQGKEDVSTRRSPVSSPDSRAVDDRVLDGENFVTEWNDLLPPLPPPPDHGLHSPIIDAVLDQWTDDRALHRSLVSWMEEVMKGNDLESLPPLMISSLDHQVRDGFVMHVLPLLLRRADIYVMVQTRAQRQTTYDLSVTVTQKSVVGSQKFASPPSLLDRQYSSRDTSTTDQWMEHFEPRRSATESVAHSSVTDAVTNVNRNLANAAQNLQRPASQSPDDEYSTFASRLRTRSNSGDYSQDGSIRSGSVNGVNGNGTIMGALGGALSGLLSRNRYAGTPERDNTEKQISDPRDSNTMRASLRAELDLTASPVPNSSNWHYYAGRAAQMNSADKQHIGTVQPYEHDEPYHRVVSAPPGRIGVTFVEYRGHAMVSDVAADSPLSGFVFPSDVLIAVDEIPVSGMRVRDIVQILSDRKGRQRALRMISSHDMNDFTSAVNTSEFKTVDDL